MSKAKRQQQRVINAGTAVVALVLIASALSTVVENVVGGLFVVALAALVILEFWPDTVGEWRKDRALVREVGEWDDPNTPILLVGPDGTESIIKFGDKAYPTALVTQAQQARAAELARRNEATP